MEGNKYFSRRSDSFVKLPVSHTDNTLFYCRLTLAFLRLQKKTFHLCVSIKILMLIDTYKLINCFLCPADNPTNVFTSFVNNLGEISPESPLSPNSQTIRGPSSWVNLFALDISSTTMAKFHQNRRFPQIHRFRQIRKLFGALLAGLIYSRSTFRPQGRLHAYKLRGRQSIC